MSLCGNPDLLSANSWTPETTKLIEPLAIDPEKTSSEKMSVPIMPKEVQNTRIAGQTYNKPRQKNLLFVITAKEALQEVTV